LKKISLLLQVILPTYKKSDENNRCDLMSAFMNWKVNYGLQYRSDFESWWLSDFYAEI